MMQRKRSRIPAPRRLHSPAPFRAPQRASHPAFTLLELMVVIGIIAIMLVAVIPSVTSLMKANGQKSAVTTVMNLLEQARALAVTSGSPTYVVFPDSSTPEAYRCKALIVFQDNAAFTPVAVTKWTFLPTGVSFRPGVGLLTPQAAIRFLCPGTVSANAQPVALPFLKFDATGMVAAPTGAGALFADIFSGFVDSSGAASYTDKNQQTSQKFDSVQIARFTGRARYVDPFAG